MAITQADRMLSSVLCSLCLSVLALPAGTASSLHLHQERRHILPQIRGFFTVGANLDVRRAAAPAPLAASGAQEPRSRRSAGRSAMPEVYGQANLNDSHNQMVVHWAGEKSNVIVALARDSTAATGPKTSSVYVSYNYGTTFIPVSANFQLSEAKVKNGSKQVISQFYHSPVDNRRYLFVDSTNNYLWSTFDFCKTVQGFSVPFRPTDLLLHPRHSNLLLGYDGSHPNKQNPKSSDVTYPVESHLTSIAPTVF